MNQISSYKKLRCLYKGYAGKVYLIEIVSENQQPNQPKQVQVLKRYYRKLSDNCDVTHLNEYQILKNIDHENIMKLIDFFTEKYQHKKYLCLTFDYMAPLNEMIPLLKNSHLYIFKQICQGLQYLHQNKLIHRDIKPSNIFGSLEGKIKIGDFGISSKIKPQLTPQTCTKNYRPPELFFGQTDYDYSIDVWSLGCTIIEMFTGKILFGGKSEIEIMSQITEQIGSMNETNWEGVSKLPNYLEFINESEPKLQYTLSKLPIEIKPILESMMSMNPKKRPSISMILEALQGVEDKSDEVKDISYRLINQVKK